MPPEELLEKQYRKYKAEFEEWKINYRSLEGSEGYAKYVKQFEQWEKDVEVRRANVRNKALADSQQREAAQQELHQQQEQGLFASNSRLYVQTNAYADQAARYAKQQESYMAIHQRALEEQERKRKAIADSQQQPQTQTQSQTSHSHAEIFAAPQLMSEVPPPAQCDELQQQIWTCSYSDYAINDPMNAKWGAHAAPPNNRESYRPPPVGTPVAPAWYLQRRLEEEGFVYDNSIPLVGAPEIIQMTPPPSIQQAPPPPLPSHPQIDFSMPPPNMMHVAPSAAVAM